MWADFLSHFSEQAALEQEREEQIAAAGISRDAFQDPIERNIGGGVGEALDTEFQTFQSDARGDAGSGGTGRRKLTGDDKQSNDYE